MYKYIYVINLILVSVAAKFFKDSTCLEYAVTYGAVTEQEKTGNARIKIVCIILIWCVHYYTVFVYVMTCYISKGFNVQN